MRFFENLFRHKKAGIPSLNSQETSRETAPILPESIRYALRYKNGEISPAEITSLIDSWPDQAIYATAKLLDSDKVRQQDFLQQIYSLAISGKDDVEIKNFLRSYVTSLKKDGKTNVIKLSAVSRYNPITFQAKMENVINTALDAHPDSLLHLVAYSTLMCFRKFSCLMKSCGIVECVLVVPGWLENSQDPYLGYLIKTEENRVELLRKSDSTRIHKKPIFIDDTIVSGKSFDKIMYFWQHQWGVTLSTAHLFVELDFQNQQ